MNSKMGKCRFAWLALMLVLVKAGLVVAVEHPNVIVILTDDQGWGDLSCNGNQNLSTPNLDSLARDGARFDRFYVCPVCSLTRAEFLTGRYHPRSGVTGVTEGDERMDPDERTIADVFKSAGYRTAAFGKWHNGTQHPYHPNSRGFDEFYGYCSGHWGDYFSPPLEANGRPVKGDGYLVDDFTQHAIDFIDRHAQEQFFVYLAMPTPHSPMQVPDEYWNRFSERSLTMKGAEKDEADEDFTRAALAMVECIDANVGKLLAKLDSLQLKDDTIVVFFSDNGPNSFRWNGGMKGKKGSVDEGGVRSPLFIRWPNGFKGDRFVLQISGVIDLLPTLADLAEIPVLSPKPLDGISLEPLLVGRSGALPDRMLFSHWNKKLSVRTQHYRFNNKGQLYDMVTDPGQTKDVSGRFPELKEEFDVYLGRWEAEVLNSAPPSSERPFPVGFPDFPITPLPARDGQPHGYVKRSARAPNCSYFTNWAQAGDYATWDIEVLAGGNFEIEVYYTCPEESVGTELKLSVGEQELRQTIDQAHTSVAVGPEHDRVPRVTQSPIKDFAALAMGKMRLKLGKYELQLQSMNTVGEAGIEIQKVVFHRVR